VKVFVVSFLYIKGKTHVITVYGGGAEMATIFDVAKYILEKQGEMTAMKLQKLTYYVKVWGLVWDEEEIFPETFEAWANGAVSPELYNRHRGLFKVSSRYFLMRIPDLYSFARRKQLIKF